MIEGQVNSTIRVLEGLLSEDGEHMARLEDWITEIQEGDVQIVRATRMRKGAPGPEHFRELVSPLFVSQNLF